MKDTFKYLVNTDFPAIKRARLETLQVNLGYLCNQQCTHCHVNAGPRRKEIMSEQTISDVLNYLSYKKIKTLDLTGGYCDYGSLLWLQCRSWQQLWLRICLTESLEPVHN